MQQEFSLQYVFTVIKKWLRPITAFVLLCTLGGALAALVLPKQYVSVATVVPANPLLADKTFLFGGNVQELNSVYGVEEDLDRLLATATLDGNLNFLADSFRLTEHYGITGKPEKAHTAAFKKIKKNSRIVKTETGSVKIYVWDTDRNLAAAMANALVAKTEQLNRDNNKKANAAYLEQLQQSIAQQSREYETVTAALKTMPPSAAYDLQEVKRKTLMAGIEQSMTLARQLQIANTAENPGLVTLEKAWPSTTADKPKLWKWLAAAFFASVIFAVFMALILESFKRK